MPILFADGFESGDFSKWNSTSNCSVQSGIVHHGSKAMTTSYGGLTYYPNNPCFYLGMYVYLTGNVLFDNCRLIRLFPFSYDSNVFVTLDQTTNAVSLVAPSGTYLAGISLSLNRWYCLEVERKIGVGNGEAQLWVDGVLKVSKLTETINNNTQEVDIGSMGSASEIYSLYVDCITFADTRIGLEGYGQAAKMSTQNRGRIF